MQASSFSVCRMCCDAHYFSGFPRGPWVRYNPRELQEGTSVSSWDRNFCFLYLPTMALIAIIVTVLCIFLWCTSKQLVQYVLLMRIPGPRGHLVFGHLQVMLSRDYHRRLAAWSRVYGPIYRINVLGVQGLVISEPRVIATILGQDRGVSAVPKLSAYQELDMLWSTKGKHTVFTATHTDKVWRIVRKAAASSFSAACIRQKFPMVRRKVMTLANIIERSGPEKSIDMDDAGMRLALDVVALASFHHNFVASQAGRNRVVEVLSQALEECQRRFMNPFQRFSLTQDAWDARLCASEFRLVCKHLLRSLRDFKSAHASFSKFPSLGEQLLQILDHEEGEKVDDEQLQAEIGTFIMAGYETTAHTLSFTLHSIASNEEVQQSIHQEFQRHRIFDEANNSLRDIEYADLPALTYLGAVLKESMRMLPVVAAFPRISEKDMMVNGLKIPEGTFLYLSFFSLHNSDKYWEHPQVFNPSRWLNEDNAYVHLAEEDIADIADQGLKKPGDEICTQQQVILPCEGIGPSQIATQPYVHEKRFFPFSEGPRNCIGQGLATMELKTALAVLCQRFKFNIAKESLGLQGIDEKMALTLQAMNGVRLQCVPQGTKVPGRYRPT